MAGIGSGGSTNLWELAPLALSILQFVLYIAGFRKYCERLEELAEDLQVRAEERYEQYQMLRDRDPEFYAYYDGLPDYSICESNVKRSKGAAFAAYGNDLRRGYGVVRGYTPLAKVQLTGTFADNAIFNSSLHRATTLINERSRVDGHVLQRWNAIVDTPIHIEGASSHNVGHIINQSFKTLRAFGQGANAAGTQLGASLYRVFT